MRKESNVTITVPAGKTIGEVTRETKSKAEYEGYITNQELGNDGVYLICKRRGETHRIYIRNNKQTISLKTNIPYFIHAKKE